MQDIVDRITRRFNEDQQLKPKATTADQIPISYESMTPQWLTAVLCRDVPGAAVVALELGPADDGSSNRRRIHLTYNEAGRQAKLPPSVFCKAAHALLNRIMLTVAKCTYVESTFYMSLRPRLQITAPKAYFANYDEDAGTQIIMLNDIAGEATFCDERTPVDREVFSRQIDTLAELHGRTHADPQLRNGFLTWPKLWRTHMQLGHEQFCDKGFVAAGERGWIPARLVKRRAEIWPRTMECVDRHAALPQMVTHNDVHLKNWFATRDGRMGLGDWQTVAVGNWSRDFAYAISTALTIENRRAWEKDLLRMYLEKLRERGGPAVLFEEAWTLYRQQLFTALAFWTLTLTPSTEQPDMQPEHTTEAFLKRIGAAIDDLDALDSFGG